MLVMNEQLKRVIIKFLKDKLLEIMLKAAEFNPSDTLEKSKGEHPLKSIMGKFSKKDEVGESEQW